MKTLVSVLTLALAVSVVPTFADMPDLDPSPSPESVCDTAEQEDQIWLVSTRCYPTVIGRTLDFEHTKAKVLDVCGQHLQDISLCEPLGSQQTWLFVHGNQIPACEAIRRGVKVYRKLRSCACTAGPIRFIIWSWPSERTKGRVRDAKEKAVRTDAESFLLGSFLNRLASEAPTSIVGYSFGSRIVSGALHLSSGGSLCGYRLPCPLECVCPLRVTFLAAAVEDNAFARCGRYRRGLDDVESLVLLNNSRDAALNFFWIIGGGHPKAMGDEGLAGRTAPTCVQQTDWKKQIGRDHSLWQYFDRPPALRRITAAIAR